MSYMTDKKPKAKNNPIMFRTRESVIRSGGIIETESGDTPHSGFFFNTTFETFDDSDPRWGLDVDYDNTDEEK